MNKYFIKNGIGIMIFKQGKVLLGKRKGSHGAGEYAFPGGHLEYLESFQACAIRETKEETGIDINNIKFQYVANVDVYKPKHYVHIGLLAEWAGGEPAILEPDKIESWNWYDLHKLPAPLFMMTALSFDALNTKKQYYDLTDVRSSH